MRVSVGFAPIGPPAPCLEVLEGVQRSSTGTGSEEAQDERNKYPSPQIFGL